MVTEGVAVERRGRGRDKRREEREASQPIYLTAIYHSESMCQQLPACFMVDWLPLPPPSPPPSKVVQALCVCAQRQDHIGARGAAEGGGRGPGAMALLLDASRTTAAYYCLIRRRFKRRRKKRSERKGIPLRLCV